MEKTLGTSQSRLHNSVAVDYKEQEYTWCDSGGASKRPKPTPMKEEAPPPAGVHMGESEEGEPIHAAEPDEGVTTGGAGSGGASKQPK